MDGIGNSAAVQQSKPFAYQDFDLTSAIVNRRLDIPGENLYCDQYSTGSATIRMNAQNNIESAPILIASGTQINGKFVSFVLDSPAQAGKVLRLIIGAPNYFVKPAAQSSANPGVTTISGNVTVIDSLGTATRHMATSAGSLAVGTDVATIFTQAQNPNGLILRGYFMGNQGGASGAVTTILMAALVTPTTTGAQLNAASLSMVTGVGGAPAASNSDKNFNEARRIPAGWGLFLITAPAGVAAASSFVYLTVEVL